MNWSRVEIFLLVTLFCFLIAISFGEELLDRIVAKVGNEIILESELNEQVGMYLAQTGATLDSTQLKELKNRILEQMIDNKILLAETKRDSIEVKKSELNEALGRAIEEIKARFPTEEEFQKRLVEEGKTEEGLKRGLEGEVKDRLLIQKLLDKRIRPKVEVSPKEVEEFYKTHKDSLPTEPEKVRIAHILVTVKPGEEEVIKAHKKMEEVLTKLKAGAKFSTLAEKYSEDQGSSQKGGDLGFFKRGEMVPEFEQAAFALKPGEISKVVETRFGFHLIRCEEKKDDQIRVRHILIQVTPSEEDFTRAKKVALSLRERILKGEDFVKIAKSYSDDLDSKDKGGDLGFYPVDRLPPAFKDAVAVLKVGEVSDVVRTEYGFHILKLEAREEGKIYSFEEIKGKLSEYVHQTKMQKLLVEWLKELRKKVYIENKL